MRYLIVDILVALAWSAPSAIGTGGMVSEEHLYLICTLVIIVGQIGAEVTDFVIVLNSRDSVKSFMHGGNVTLGGNLSGIINIFLLIVIEIPRLYAYDKLILSIHCAVAAGPVGRTAEGAGSVSVGHVAAIFSYSKTKGLFVGRC